MDLKDKVAEWLEKEPQERDFREGLVLFNHLPGNFNLKRLFALKGDVPYNREKMTNELKKFCGSGKAISLSLRVTETAAVTPGSSKQKKQQPSPQEKSDASRPEADPEAAEKIKALVDERNEKFRRAVFLHDRLDLVDDQTERHGMCLEIYWAFQRINQIYRITGEYEKTGELLKEVPLGAKVDEPPLDFTRLGLAKLITTRNNLRAQRTKAKNNPEKLARVSAELALVEELIQKKETEQDPEK